MSFFDGNSKSLSFGEVGDDTWKGKPQGGVIVSISDAVQATVYGDTSTLKTWPNGDPVMKIVFTLDTRAGKYPAPPADEEDDGVRDFHVEKGSQAFRALSKALKDSGAKDFEVGGELYDVWQSGVGRKGDPRLHVAQYTPPAPGTKGMFAGEPEQPAAPSFPAAQMPPQQPGNPFGQKPAPVQNGATSQEAQIIEAISAAGSQADIGGIWQRATDVGIAWTATMQAAADARIAALAAPPAASAPVNPFAAR